MYCLRILSRANNWTSERGRRSASLLRLLPAITVFIDWATANPQVLNAAASSVHRSEVQSQLGVSGDMLAELLSHEDRARSGVRCSLSLLREPMTVLQASECGDGVSAESQESSLQSARSLLREEVELLGFVPLGYHQTKEVSDK